MSSLTRQLAALAMSAPLLLAQSLRLTDGGVERDYVIATDEVHLAVSTSWVPPSHRGPREPDSKP
jgi:hypothetical protein